MVEQRQHPRRLGSTMEQLRLPHKKIVGIEMTAENDGVDMFEQAGVAAK